MGWFDEQIRRRKNVDEGVLEDALLNLSTIVTKGEKVHNRNDAKSAVYHIMDYFGIKPVEIPDVITDEEEQIRYCFSPNGIMYRRVYLKGGWFKNSFGPLLVKNRKDGEFIAVFPKGFGKYSYVDSNNKKITIDKQIAEGFEEMAYCFYNPFPLKKLGILDLIVFIRKCLDIYDIAMFVFLAFLATIIGMLLPKLTLIITGFVLDEGSVSILAGTFAFIVCIVLSTQIINVCKDYAENRIKIKTDVYVEAAIMMRVINLHPTFFKDYSAGELTSRINSIEVLSKLLVTNVFGVGLTSIMSLLYLVEIWNMTPGLTIPAFCIVGLTSLTIIFTTYKQMIITKKRLEYSSKENGLTYAFISGIQKIKLAGAENRAFAKWADIYTKQAKLAYNPPLYLKLYSTITLAITLIGTIVLYYQAIITHVTASEYIAFNAAYGVLMGAFTSLASIAISAAEIKPIMDMVGPILEARPEIDAGKERILKLSGAIELNNIFFRYKENMPYVLNGLNLKIKPGEYIAIVGRTGCGKSTLVRLLLGFEQPEKGAIYYDGKDISRVDMTSLRRKIGVVSQDGCLFTGDIYSNIVITNPKLTLDDAWKAAEIAGIADDIREMPMGMHTMISEGQGGISGGQKQRLMIARAIAPKPKILIFDEATSALDNITQKNISNALDKLNCTRIVIAHRLSTIKNCDRIIVINDGNIIEEGKYDDLIKENGYFAKLVERQQV